MPLTFRPQAYNEGDFLAVKYTGPTSRQEGVLCRIGASTTRSIVTATPWSGINTALPTVVAGATATVYHAGYFFPVFKENPDNQTIAGTINQNDMVLAYQMHRGNEFEVHSDMVQNALGSFAINTQVTLGSQGNFSYFGGTQSTGLVLGLCLGTYGGKWLRVRVI